MRTYTTTVREGEKTGAVDWDYNFRQHFDTLCTSDAGRDEACARQVAKFREIADAHAEGKTVRATTYGGLPRVGYREVLDVGMYDGWPYWRPVPSVLIRGVLGGAEWHAFSTVTDYEPANVAHKRGAEGDSA